jgi:LmbE family N-acetylglucosaminyl deacetylase
MMLRSLFLGLFVGFGLVSVHAADLGLVSTQQALKDLGTDLRLMCVAAHPDDEDGASLAFHRFRHGIKTYALIATKGEGGQNEIGPELYEHLAVIRAEEMAAAAEIEGAELHFLNLREFGYSKTLEETLGVWGREETLRRMVRKIRELRPHVIITHHGRMKDHGHHQAIGWATLEAFDVAADPEAFQDEGEAWQPLRLFIRDFSQTSETAAVVNISALDNTRGKTYTEIAADALRAHKSQGMAFFIDRLLDGQPKAYYDLVKEAPGTNSVAPLDDSFGPLFAAMRVTLSPVRRAAVYTTPDPRMIPALQIMQDDPDIAADAREVERQVRAYRVEVFPEDPIVVPGQQTGLRVEFRDFGAPEAATFQVGAGEALTPDENRAVETTLAYTVPGNAPLTMPRHEHVFEESYGRPNVTMPYQVAAKDGSRIFTGNAETYVDVAPPVSVDFLEAPYLHVPGTDARITADVRFRNYTPGSAQAEWAVTPPNAWESETLGGTLAFSEEDEEQVRTLAFTVPQGVAAGDYPFTVNTPGEKRSSLIRVVDVIVPEKKKVGVIESYDDTFMKTLHRLGVPHAAITDRDFSHERLDAFGTIIVDIRAYQYRPDLVANNRALLDWVKRGGTLLVQYQKTFDWIPEYAPYEINLSRNRVTKEDAPLTILQPEHPFFNTPNKLGQDDWANWIQERGLYFPVKWDDAYTPLIETHDPGEVTPPGSLLIADYGEGTYLYTALGWYRQLRELHPGALRAFANMLAL